MSVARTYVEDGVGIIEIDSPPVNALGLKVRIALLEWIEKFVADPSVQAIVLICAGRTFFAGADITELGKPPQPPDSRTMALVIENASKPTIAAIHGTALGGGYEMALICHYRIAVASAQFGLPEVALGLMPGAGGTQRLPRIIGPVASLDLMTSGRRVSAKEAISLGMIDALAREDKLREDSIAFARKLLADGRPLQRIRDRNEKVDPYKGRPDLFREFRSRHAEDFRGFKAPESIIKAVEAAVELAFDEGMNRERELFTQLRASRESAAQRYLFFAEREAAKGPSPLTPSFVPVERIAMIGAGASVEVAIDLLDAGTSVALIETEQVLLDRVRDSYSRRLAEGGISSEDVERRLARLTHQGDKAGLASADLVIVTPAEETPPGETLCGLLDRTCKPDAVLAFGGSPLHLEEMVSSISRPERVAGIHFLPHRDATRLVEVVQGVRTAPQVVATLIRLAKQMGHVAMISRHSLRPLADRLIANSELVAHRMVQDGHEPQEIEAAFYNFGFRSAPFGFIGCRQTEPIQQGIDLRQHYSSEQFILRLLAPVVNEGAKIMEEGATARSSDLDVASVLACGWPAYTGGPMFWADTVGPSIVLDTLLGLESQYGQAFQPAGLLRKMAQSGDRFTHG